MTPSPDPSAAASGRTVSRRSVLRSAGVIAVGGVGMAAGFGLRGVADAAPGETGAAVAPSSSPVLIAAASGSPRPSPSGAGAQPAPPGPRHAFRSRPDLVPPVLLVSARPAATAGGLLFTTPNNGGGPDGPTIYDDAGDPVWVRPGKGRHATDLHVIQWKGAPALVWWEGDTNGGVGDGEFVIVDQSYAEIARLASGAHADLHELQLTPSGTALFSVYQEVPVPDAPGQASPAAGSPKASHMYDCVVVELDLASGQRVREWHSADHLTVDESEVPRPDDPDAVWDPFHVNSIELDSDGNLLVSARNTSCIYKVDRSSGEVLWRLGGKRGDITLLGGLTTALQHDVRRRPDGTITIFDNRRPPETARGIVIEVDEQARTARLVNTLERPEPVQAASQGSYQLLPNGHVLIGWGAQSVMTEFDADGTVVWDGSIPGGVQSYRDLRFPWIGRPQEAPALAADPQGAGSGTQRRVTAYASWNGATEVSAWRLLAAGAEGPLADLATIPRRGFETVLTGVTTADPVTRIQAQALDATGNVLAETAVIAPAVAPG